MNQLKQLSARQQVLLTFGTLCAVLLSIGGLSFLSFRAIERSNQLQSRAVIKLDLINDLGEDVGMIQSEVLQQVLSSDAGLISNLDRAILEIEKSSAERLAAYREYIDADEENLLYEKLVQARKVYWEQTQPVMALSRANLDTEARQSINSTQAPAFDAFVKAGSALNECVEAAAADAAASTARFISRIRIVSNTLDGIAILIAIGTAFAVAGIARRLKKDNGFLQTEVAERKRAEETLRESDRKFHQLADHITDAFWIRSPDGRTVDYVSPAFEKIWGRSVGSLYAAPHLWGDFIFKDDRERVLAAFAALTGETSSLDLEYRIVRPEGDIRWIRVRGFQVRDAAGNLVNLTGIVTDITEMRHAVEELRESDRRFRDMLRNLELVAMMLDRDAKVIYCNDYLLRLTGWQREEVIGRSWFDLFMPPEIVAESRIVYSALLADESSAWHHENEILTRSGARRLLRWNNSVLRSVSGDVIGTANIGEDITERKQLEAQLFQSQKMETVGKLAGGVAHEFNSIMTSIIGQSELMLGALAPMNPLYKNASEIRKAADRAAILTRQLLAYGRKQILQAQILDLNSILAGMEDTLRHLMGRDVDLRIVPAAGLKTVRADAGQVEQVIMNLAINAADAMPDGGIFTIETANVMLDQEFVSHVPDLKAGEYVVLVITDTGIGLSDQAKAHLFEPFFSTKHVGEGTGLGLSTCYGIIKQSGGHIAVYSEPNRGTAFKIYLPHDEQQTNHSIENSADLPRGTERIVLVESDPALSDMAATLLRRLGYSVLTAASGADWDHIDLLITDEVPPLRVPGLNPNARILFTSIQTKNSLDHQSLFLQKPFTPSALAHKLRDVFEG